MVTSLGGNCNPCDEERRRGHRRSPLLLRLFAAASRRALREQRDEADLAIQRMRTGIPVRFKPAKGGVRLEGVVIDCDPATGLATAIEPLRVDVG